MLGPFHLAAFRLETDPAAIAAAGFEGRFYDVEFDFVLASPKG